MDPVRYEAQKEFLILDKEDAEAKAQFDAVKAKNKRRKQELSEMLMADMQARNEKKAKFQPMSQFDQQLVGSNDVIAMRTVKRPENITKDRLRTAVCQYVSDPQNSQHHSAQDFADRLTDFVFGTQNHKIYRYLVVQGKPKKRARGNSNVNEMNMQM